VIPIVAIEVEAPVPSPALQQVLLDACSASLSYLDCLPASSVKGQEPAAVAMISAPEPDVLMIELADATLGEWRSRRLVFDAEDPAAERWRAVGFSVGSLLGASDRPLARDPVATTPDALPSDADDPVGVGAWLGGVAGVGLDRSGWRAGVELGSWVSFWRFGDPYLSAAYATAIDPPQQLRLRLLDVAVGASWAVARASAWSVRFRLQGDLQHQRVSAPEPLTSVMQERTAWAPGVKLGLDGAWSFAPRWALVLKLDGLVQDGATTITYASERVGAVPARTLLAGLGIQFEP
jgi:hypothetical protein